MRYRLAPRCHSQGSTKSIDQQASLTCLGLLLFVNIVEAEAPVGKCPTLPYQLCAHVLSFGIETHGDDAPVPIDIALLADHRVAGNETAKGRGGLPPALDFRPASPAPLLDSGASMPCSLLVGGSLLMGLGAVPALAQDAENGRNVFEVRCQKCHTTESGGGGFGGRGRLRFGFFAFGTYLATTFPRSHYSAGQFTFLLKISKVPSGLSNQTIKS